jgi:hypothetical protein
VPVTAPPVVHEVLNSTSQPLDRGVRAAMETRLGGSFERVRVHTGELAARSANAVDAAAYTVGRSIVFGRGAFVPQRPEGRRLLAHELMHTMQQGLADPRAAGHDLRVGQRDSAEEREAQRSDARPNGVPAASPPSPIRPLQVSRGGDSLPGGVPPSVEDYDFQRPDPPKPGSPEAVYEEEAEKGRKLGETIADAKQGLATLQKPRAGKSVWDTMSQAERTKYLGNIEQALESLPEPGTYSDPAVADAAKRGFQAGVGDGEQQTALKYLAVWAATELAIALAAGRASRPAATAGRGLGATGAGITEAAIDKLAATRYDAIRKAGEAQLPTVAKNTGLSVASLKQIFAHLFVDEHAVAVGPGRVTRMRFDPDSEIAELWSKSVRGPLQGDDLARFKDLMAHEAVERKLMQGQNMAYRSSASEAWKKGTAGGWEYHPTPSAYGAHDLAPLASPMDKGPLKHWAMLKILGD